ncbi:GTP pyrophosphokinase [Vibrio sp. M260112]|uniref:GTP pyrophosphokinase n=1 Tax=Vibrio sp. M260112 TaxID=3020895 RepID=UPI002F4020B6
MNQAEFLEKWNQEKPMYQAWGDFVVYEITRELEQKGYDISTFLKQPAKARVKSNESLIDKAFYRPSKSYDDPYNDIEDKVGGRFVVLLVEQIEAISNIIKSSALWSDIECRHFDNERNKDPLLFTYQSVHYVVRASKDIEFQGQKILKDTPCELQLRTLLQHAYAELTHDAIYKAKRRVEPKVHRTVAKSMALIETTDDFFSDVNNSLNHGAIEDFKISQELDSIYKKLIGVEPMKMQKSSLVILDEFEDLISERTAQDIKLFLAKNEFVKDVINDNYQLDPFYKQSISIFSSWLIMRKRNRATADWPLDFKLLSKLGTDLGVSVED